MNKCTELLQLNTCKGTLGPEHVAKRKNTKEYTVT